MAKYKKRRQVGGQTTKGDRITVGRVSRNGRAFDNAKAKGCFVNPLGEKRKRQ